jgi:hypothetical protein
MAAQYQAAESPKPRPMKKRGFQKAAMRQTIGWRSSGDNHFIVLSQKTLGDRETDAAIAACDECAFGSHGVAVKKG